MIKQTYLTPTVRTIVLEAESLMLDASSAINLPVTDGAGEQTITGSAPEGETNPDPGYWSPW